MCNCHKPKTRSNPKTILYQRVQPKDWICSQWFSSIKRIAELLTKERIFRAGRESFYFKLREIFFLSFAIIFRRTAVFSSRVNIILRALVVGVSWRVIFCVDSSRKLWFMASELQLIGWTTQIIATHCAVMCVI